MGRGRSSVFLSRRTVVDPSVRSRSSSLPTDRWTMRTSRSSAPRPTTPARALTRARRYEQEHDVAVALQRSLLPEELPALDGVELAGRYNAGGVGLEIGGDWYDAVLRPDGILHLTVGDVAGSGYRSCGPDGTVAERLPGARLRAHVAGRDRPATDAPRSGGRDGDRRLPDPRPLHRRASLRLGRSSAFDPARCRQRRRYLARPGGSAAARLGGRHARSARRGWRYRPR